MAIVDAATMLMPQGTYSTSQALPGLELHPRHLATAVVTIAVQVPPVASAVFAVEVASTQAGDFPVHPRLAWPAAMSGARHVAAGASASAAQLLSNTSAWIRLSLTTTGALTGSAWLTTSRDGSFGLASRSYALDGLGAL